MDENSKFQEIDGWVAMSVLSATERDKILRALFDTSGFTFDLGRISMSANDFSVTFNSNNNTPNEYSMANFSLARDSANILPFALAAKAVNPKLKFWDCPHSPPAWMKTNGNMV